MLLSEERRVKKEEDDCVGRGLCPCLGRRMEGDSTPPLPQPEAVVRPAVLGSWLQGTGEGAPRISHTPGTVLYNHISHGNRGTTIVLVPQKSFYKKK